jgi:hypothetical protein
MRFVKALLRSAFTNLSVLLKTDVTWNSDDESLVASTTGQPRGDCPYSNNLDFCRGCTPVPALDLDDRRNSIHVTSVKSKSRWRCDLFLF